MKITSTQYAKALFELTYNQKEEEIKPVLDNFIKILTKNNDLNKIDDIIKEFSNIWDQKEGKVRVEIISARPLNEDILNLVKEYLSQKIEAKTFEIQHKIDKKILGGVIIKLKDKILDASLTNCLNRLKEHIQ